MSEFIKQWISGERSIQRVLVVLKIKSNETAAHLIGVLEFQLTPTEIMANRMVGHKVFNVEETVKVHMLRKPYPEHIMQELRTRFPVGQDLEKCYGKLYVEREDGTILVVIAQSIGGSTQAVIDMVVCTPSVTK